VINYQKIIISIVIFVCSLTEVMATSLVIPSIDSLLEEDRLKILVVIGMPGSGKGTFGQYLSNNYSIGHISIGDLVREEENKNKHFQEFTQKMKLLPFEEIWPLVIKRIKLYLKSGINVIILDGFPRDINQARSFNRILQTSKKTDVIYIYLKIKEKIAVERIKYRQICSSCKHIYNKKYFPAKNGTCSYCGAIITNRKDDKFINRRMKKAKKSLKEILDIYKPYLIEISTNDNIKDLYLKYDALMKNLNIVRRSTYQKSP
jgi:adenylate kinase